MPLFTFAFDEFWKFWKSTFAFHECEFWPASSHHHLLSANQCTSNINCMRYCSALLFTCSFIHVCRHLLLQFNRNIAYIRPANNEKFLNGSFPGKSRGGRGKVRMAADWRPKGRRLRPKAAAGMGFLGGAVSPLSVSQGSTIFHCFGH